MSTIQYLLGVQAVTFMCRLSGNSGSLYLLEPERPVKALLRDDFISVLLFGPKELSLSLSLTHTHTHTLTLTHTHIHTHT